MMLDISENPDWNLGEEEDPEDTNCEIGEETLDRLSLALGGKVLVPELFKMIPNLFASEDWRQRYAALMAISIVGEGSAKVISEILPNIIKLILHGLSDGHPRVRWAACNTIGQMATDFAEYEFQQSFHKEILPALVSVMDDKDNARVQAHAASAVINFCEHCSPELLEPFLDGLLSKLLVLLHQGNKIVQEQAVTAIAAIADCIQDQFTKYYDTFMPFLKSVLSNATSKDYRILRGKAMECISLIGVAVGKEKFGADAKEVMEQLMATQGKLEEDDPQKAFVLQAWARFCKCLGPHFVPFLPYIMPPLLASAKLQPDLKVTDEECSDEEGWEYLPVGDKKSVGIKTSILEEKATACNMLYCYAEELKEGFFQFVEPVASIVIPLMKFYYHDNVRSAAVSTVPCLLTSLSLALPNDRTMLFELWGRIFPVLLEAMVAEIENEILLGMIEALQNCVEIVGENCLNPNQLEDTVKAVKSLLGESFQRRKQRLEEADDQDFDPEEEERLGEENEKEEDILSMIGDLVGKLTKTHKERILPLFQQYLLAEFLVLVGEGATSTDRHVGLCVFDDIAEFLETSALGLYQHFLPPMLNNLADPHSAVRQAAVYGIGVCSQFGGDLVKPFVPQVLATLDQVIADPSARSEENVYATENAISAIAKICRFHAPSISLPIFLPRWLSFLPVTEDKIESKVTYSHLCYFIENLETRGLLLNGLENLGKVLSIFGTILETNLIDDTLTQRIRQILQFLQTDPSILIQLPQCFLSLSDEQKTKLHKCSAGN